MTKWILPAVCVFLGLAVAAKGGNAAVVVAAAAGTIASSNGLQTRALRDFRSFLQMNPQIAGALKADPVLMRDGGFRGAHPELQTYLATHRPFAQRFEKRPRLVMNQIATLKH